MAEILGTAASIVSLIGAAVTIIQQIEAARRNVKGAPKTFADVSKQLNAVSQSLDLVKAENRLQTPVVGDQVRTIIKIAEDLKLLIEDVYTNKRKLKFIPSLVRALKTGDEENRRLVEILSQLDRARAELILRISVSHVGLTGDLEDGVSVVINTLLEINGKVDNISGKQISSRDLKGSTREPGGDGQLLSSATSHVISAPHLRITGRTGDVRISGNADTVTTGIEASTAAVACIDGKTGCVEANNIQCAVTGVSVKF